jgi:hypothetical protein
VPVEPLSWDGKGTIADVGETYALLDAPAHPNPGAYFAGIAADDGRVLDGGVAHYTGGGVLSNESSHEESDTSLSFLNFPVGVADGRDIEWSAFDVLANDERATGLSLVAAQDPQFGAKLVFHEGHEFGVGDEVRVELTASDDPIRLG